MTVGVITTSTTTAEVSTQVSSAAGINADARPAPGATGISPAALALAGQKYRRFTQAATTPDHAKHATEQER